MSTATSAEVERCSGSAGNPLFNTLCLQDYGFPRPAEGEFPDLLQPASNQKADQCRRVRQPSPARHGAPSTAPGPVAITKGGPRYRAINDDKILGH